jgi:signal transduction histidine kinase/CheY-like chemotaxis protein/HPt (histidine-containing phosphotransfer) domain-containing protein
MLAPPSHADAEAPRPAALDRPKLLIVDDEPANIRLLNAMFAADHQVLMATGGEQALRVCREQVPDLVLLDVEMPDVDGHEVCRRLKADPATRDIAVIFVTAQDEAAQESFGLALGAVDFIAKPVNESVVRARVRTHLALARSKAIISATLEATAEGIVVTDLSGRITAMNGRFAAMWQLPARPEATDAATARACMESQVVHVEAYRKGLAEAVAPTRDAAGFDAIELTGDRHFERAVTPLRVNGTRKGLVFSFRDVTERRRAENALGLLNASLESRIVERTRELELAKHEADAASQAKSDFLSNMSHEIRTPMSGVIGMAYLALQSDPSPSQRQYLQKIHDSGQHLLSLVNDILDFSKIEAGRLTLEERDFDLRALLDGVADQMADGAAAKGLSLRFAIDPAVPRALRGDRVRIGQVLLNYVDNALKFTHAGDVAVRISAVEDSGDDVHLRIDVKDSGIGLSEAQRGLLFQSFQQADTSTTRQYGGTGLGLAISKRLATMMGGDVGVTSEPGRGSTFWFTVKVRHGAAPPALPAPLPIVGVAGLEQRLRGARILLVEDNLINQEVAAGLLQGMGAVVRIAGNGQEGVDAARAERFDCVLMDVQMPVMDGLAATRLIRAEPSLEDLPVLAMTANARAEDRARCLEAGMDDFMTKPIAPATLQATLATWVAGRRAGRAAAAAVPRAAAVETTRAEAPDGRGRSIDMAALARFVGSDPAQLRHFARRYLQTAGATVAEMQAALAAGDLPGLAALGHRLKSSSRMVGASRAAAMSEALEYLPPGGTTAPASGLVEGLARTMAEIAIELDRLFGPADTPPALTQVNEAARAPSSIA